MAASIAYWLIGPLSAALALSLAVAGSLGWAHLARAEAQLLPLLIAGGALLVAAVVERRDRRSTQQRLRQTVEDLREQCLINDQAIASAQQTHEGLQKKLARYTQLQAIAESLSNLTDTGSIAQLTVDRAVSLIGKSGAGLLFLVDQDRRDLALVASCKGDAVPNIHAKHGDQYDRHALRSRRPLLVNDTRRDFRFTAGVSEERAIGSVIACPLPAGHTVQGVLRLDSVQPGVYTQDDLRFLDILLDLVATSLTNAALFAQTRQLAATDGLTGLALRGPFEERLALELARAARTREPLAVLMLDIDYFKTYNDQFGHTAGDLVLKGVSDVLRNALPPEGAAARYGGEEFAVLLPMTSNRRAAAVAETIRRQVEQRFKSRARPGAALVTVSIGICGYPGDAQEGGECLRLADERLYRAKRSGRNQVCAG